MRKNLTMNEKTRVKKAWSTAAFFSNTFGVKTPTLIRRVVASRKVDDITEYEVGDFVDRCADLIITNLSKMHQVEQDEGVENSPGQLKNALVIEQVRKLRLANDEEEKLLVRRDEVLPLYMRGMALVIEKIDRIPTRIQMKAPDIPPAILNVITQCITDARNEAANGKLDL